MTVTGYNLFLPALLGDNLLPSRQAPVGRAFKFCPKCQTEKASSDFPRNKSRHDGRAAYCKACNCADNKVYKAKRPPTPKPTDGEKKCTKCGEVKHVSMFSGSKAAGDGLTFKCKACSVAAVGDWRRRNRERENRKEREWRAKNPDKVREYNKRATAKRPPRDKAEAAAYHKAYYAKNRDAILKRTGANAMARCKVDPEYRLRHAFRARFCNAMKAVCAGRYRGSLDLIGCTMAECKVFLESQFVDGMTWDNWNMKGWSVDHIRPLWTFKLVEEEQRKEAFHFRNLRPMWHAENVVRRAYDDERQSTYAARLLAYPKEKPQPVKAGVS